MIYLRKKQKITIIFILAIITILYFFSLYHKTSSPSRINNYKHLASLPAEFVYKCQQMEKSSCIPWELFAAYYQVNIEEKLISSYPNEQTLNNLKTIFQSKNNTKSVKKILSTKIKDKKLINKVYERFNLIEKNSYLFSNSYNLPISYRKLYFIDTWGEDRDNGKRAHLGTDLFAPRGTPICANTSGIIEKIGWDTLGGNRIGIRGKDGLYYYYAHLLNFAPNIKKGDKISKGKLLGYVGNTGNAINTPSHLHFGIELDKTNWINPYNFLNYWKLYNKKEAIE